MSNWSIDPSHTVAHFAAKHMMITTVHGQFNKISGVIHFDPKDMTKASAAVEIDASSIWTGVEKRDSHLSSQDFLYVEKYPTISFKSTGVEVVGINCFKLHGEITIHGITRPTILNAEFFGPNYYEDDEGSYTSIGFTATTCLNREDFGMTWNNFFGKGSFMVGKHLDITLEVEADLVSG